MNRIQLPLLGVILLGLASTAACNYPGLGAPTPFAYPTDNQTLTAIFNPTEVGLSTPRPTSGITTPETGQVTPTATSTAGVTPTAGGPTLTPSPTSAEGAAARPGASVSAAYVSSRPSIDGSLSEWTVDEHSASFVVHGDAARSGEEDLTVLYMLAWDERNLYVAARVRDDRYVQNETGEDLFKGDSLEILLDKDLAGDFFYNDLSPDDFQLGISPGSPAPGNNPEAFLWYPSSVEGARPQVSVAAVRANDGYVVEAAIPWHVFEAQPEAGENFGFVFSVSDNDDPDRSEQQTVISNVSTRRLTDPTTWGNLNLSR